MNIDCAVVYAGTGKQELLLALQSRPGRAPVTLLPSQEHIRWRCADGKEEQLRLDGTFGEESRRRIAAEIQGNQLLVAEFPDIGELEGEPERVWLLGSAPADDISELPRERH
jgi:hypothetical protein